LINIQRRNVYMELRKTALYQKHVAAKAKIIDFAGWALPLEYSSMLKEALAVRRQCGLFDATHMGQIRLTGHKASLLLESLVTNDICSLKQGAMQYNLFLNEQAGVIDDCMIYREDDGFLCVVNAVNKDTVLAWVRAKADSEVMVVDESQQLALLSIQGPQAAPIVAEAVDRSVATLAYMHFSSIMLDGHKILISRSGYTGEDGFEIYVPWQQGCYWWDRLLSVGRPYGLIPCGLGARDILRIEAGYPLYGHELTQSIDPYSAGLDWAIRPEVQCVGCQALGRIRTSGVWRKRIGFIMQERALPRQDYQVLSGSTAIGWVTSGTYSPNTESFIGMAYVRKEYANLGSEIDIEIRNKTYKAKVAHFPFISPRVKSKKRTEHRLTG